VSTLRLVAAILLVDEYRLGPDSERRGGEWEGMGD